ncbi:hypothetical protein [Aurantibacter aestuarii]|uniref:Uncharacterized protein n=1 Tax=Aurantibacter aestuarii TaxID=1266046 RepID=A0A2T1N5G1_9FLAO|nr:hypothetical protein [Aurantibacter aestuarii]PSG86450.1 hypothetical protein C7H52_12245 [Aurantibacter aestuarii]
MKKTLKYGILIFGMIILIGYFLKENTNEKFDSEKWKNWTELKSDYQLRWNMMNNLQDEYEFNGKTKTEIIELLGYPDFETPNFGIVEYFYGYCLDSSDHEKCEKQLMLKFDSKGIVISLKVYNMDK